MSLFNDGQVGSTMETAGDLSAWTGSVGTIGVSTGYAHHGLNSALAQPPGWGAGVAYKELASGQVTLFAREYIYFTNTIVTDGQYSEVLALRLGTGNVRIALVEIVKSGANLKWRLRYRHNEGSLVTALSAENISLLTPYCVEVKGYINNGAGEVRLYIDGLEVLSATGLDNYESPYNMQRVDIGAFSSFTGTALVFYIDCVVVATAYIGTEDGAPPKPKGTVNIHAIMAGMI